MLGINAGSGQRPFDRGKGWVNVDIEARWEPDIVADWSSLSMFKDASVDVVVAHHTIEHVGCGEAIPFIKESYRILKPGGSLLVFVPDMRALANRFVLREIDDFTFMVNLYGAYMGEEADRHRWGYTYESLVKLIADGGFTRIKSFDYRAIEGANIAQAWWILGVEAVSCIGLSSTDKN